MKEKRYKEIRRSSRGSKGKIHSFQYIYKPMCNSTVVYYYILAVTFPVALLPNRQ